MLVAKPLRRARFGFRGFFFAILWRRGGLERADQPFGYTSDFIDRCEKRGFVRLRRLVEASDFSYELQRSGTDFFRRDRWIKVEKGFDVPAHCLLYLSFHRLAEGDLPRGRSRATTRLPRTYRRTSPSWKMRAADARSHTTGSRGP